jgi:hypothetical protein
MSLDPIPSTQPGSETSYRPHRLFLREPGWRIALKTGSTREFCYVMAPGQDFYHRLQDGELYVFHGDERLCLACAQRRGLLSYEPKPLRESVVYLDYEGLQNPSDYDVEMTDFP